MKSILRNYRYTIRGQKHCLFIFNKRNYSRKPLREVVVTGIGIVSPLGCGTETVWQRLLAGKCGITNIRGKGYEKLPSQVAAYVPCGFAADEFDAAKYENRSRSRMTAFTLAAVDEAFDDAGWKPRTEEEKCQTGVSIGIGVSELDYIFDSGLAFKEKGYRSVSPHFIPRVLINLSAGEVSIKHELKGPNHCVSTACTTGAHTIGDAMRRIAHGDCDAMVAGSAESSITPLGVAGFCRVRALSTKYNYTPQKASRPFHPGRDGFVIGEGAAILILEEENHALKRGARVYARLAGYGMSADAQNIVSPSQEGNGAFRCMRSAIRDAGIHISDVSYINAHATSTPQGDLAESTAISTLFEGHIDKLNVSSTKGAVGHLLCASGSIEAAFTVLACHNAVLPPTINLDELDPKIHLNCLPLVPQTWSVGEGPRFALTNSFGFGGTNASLCFSSV